MQSVYTFKLNQLGRMTILKILNTEQYAGHYITTNTEHLNEQWTMQPLVDTDSKMNPVVKYTVLKILNSTIDTQQYNRYPTVLLTPNSSMDAQQYLDAEQYLDTQEYDGHPRVRWTPKSTIDTQQYIGHPTVQWTPNSTMDTQIYNGAPTVQLTLKSPMDTLKCNKLNIWRP